MKLDNLKCVIAPKAPTSIRQPAKESVLPLYCRMAYDLERLGDEAGQPEMRNRPESSDQHKTACKRERSSSLLQDGL
ncbi:hypothetical protein SAMN05443252_103174 [Bacillus sp. OV322]|nr:hypothetical protein SAMN05443252_103174 [Bacillus sp. OV322]